MILTRDFYDNIEVPAYVLCKLNGERIGEIPCLEKKMSLNELNEITFSTSKENDGIQNELYGQVTEMKMVNIEDQYRFLITSVQEDDDGVNPKKNVTAQGLEVLLGQRYLEEFYINNGEDYGINNVQLYNANDATHSLLNLVLDEKCPDWSIGHVDLELAAKQRYFEIERNDIYTFLTNDLANAFEATIVFDSWNKTVNVYKESEMGEDTNIFLSFDNLVENVQLSSSTDEIKTCMTVIGADDLNLREVNMGSDRIYMLDYYATTEFMSEDTCDAYAIWKNKVDTNKPIYAQYVRDCSDLYEQINYLTNDKMPLGGDNLIHVDGTTATINGVTFTVNATDGTITVNGTATAEAEFVITDQLGNYLEDQTIYRFVGCPLQDTSNISYYMQWYDKDDPSSKEERNSIDDGSGNQRMYETGYDRLSIFVKSGKTVNNKVFEPNVYLPDSINTDWTKYGLVPLEEKLAYYEAQQAVMIKAGQGDPDNLDYQTMYLPVYNTINDIKAQLVVIRAEIDALYVQLNLKHEHMAIISQDCSMNNNFTDEQIIELSSFIREESINSDNYVITDSMTDSERVAMLQDMLEYGENELRKVSQPQIQFSTSLVNLFNLKEFDDVSVDFKRFNYVHVLLRDDFVIKTRLLSMDIDFYDLASLSVTFGNLNRTKDKSIFADITKAINTATSVSTTVSTKSSYWNAANQDINDMTDVMKDGLVAAGQTIKTSTADVEINDNGILLKSTDPNYPNDCVLIGGSRILFSDDGFETVKEAVGRAQYTLDGVQYDRFGVIGDFIFGGYINGTRIDAGEIHIAGGTWDSTGITLPPGTKISQLDNDENYQTPESIKEDVITKDYLESLNINAGSLDIYTDNLSSDNSGLAIYCHNNLGNYGYDYTKEEINDDGLVSVIRKDVSDSSTTPNTTDYLLQKVKMFSAKNTDTPYLLVCSDSTANIDDEYKYVADPDDTIEDKEEKDLIEQQHMISTSGENVRLSIGYDGEIKSFSTSRSSTTTIGNGRILQLGSHTNTQIQDGNITMTGGRDVDHNTFWNPSISFWTWPNSSVQDKVLSRISAHSYVSSGNIEINDNLILSNSTSLYQSASVFSMYQDGKYARLTTEINNDVINFKFLNDVVIDGDFSCTGSKNRIVQTEHYGEVKMNAVESRKAHFQDYGSATIGADGTCKVELDSIFLETVDQSKSWQTFITPCSENMTNYYVSKGVGYFVVHGNPGADFDWMVNFIQK